MLFRDQTITWRGEGKSFSPAIRFLRNLDAQLQSQPNRPTNLPQVALTINNGGADYLDIPLVWAAFLDRAGFKGVTEDDCWCVLSAITAGEGSEMDKADYASFATALFHSLYPHVDLGKPDAPQEPAEQRSE